MALAFYLTHEEFKKMSKNPEAYQEAGHEEKLKKTRKINKGKSHVK